MTEELEKTILLLNNMIINYKEIKDDVIKILNSNKESIFNKDPEINEQTHMGIYNLNKIIEKLEQIVILGNNLFEEKEIDDFLLTYNNEFFKTINNIIPSIKDEIHKYTRC